MTSLPSPILITGAGGFIGSHVAELCVEGGCEVRAFVHYNAGGRRGWLDQSPARDRIEIVAGDVRDYDGIWRAMDGCRSVLHLAALIGIPYSYQSPLAYVRTNVEGTYNVLEAARQRGLDRVAVTSTSETYGTAQTVPIDETHPAVGQSPYAATKTGADQLAISYHRSFDLPVVVARPFNVYGPRQSARAFIPAVAAQILSGERSIALGNLTPTRDLTFVRDTAAGILAAAGCEVLIGSAVNIGTGNEISMGELAAKIARIVGVDVEFKKDARRVRPADSEVGRLVCDSGRLHQATGWTPQVSLEVGLRETVAWLRDHMSDYRPGIYRV
jgi:dTDP-glucose 4,6-dehydratase